MMNGRLLATVVLGFALSGCGAAFGPSVPSTLAPSSRTSRQTNVQFTLFYGIPASGLNSKVKSFRINEYGSHAASHVWDIAKLSDCVSGPQCSTLVKGDPAAPFVVESYDRAGGTGHRLSTSIVYDLGYSSISGVQLSLNQGYGSIISSLRIAFVPQNPQFGVASRMALAATAMSNRSFIVGPAPYEQPITLHVSGGMHISTTKVLTPGQAVYLSYDGGFEFAAVTASARSHSPPFGTFSSDPTTVRPMLPASERQMRPYGGQFAVARDGSLWFSSNGACALVKVQPNLTTQPRRPPKRLGCPGPLTTGPDGRVWFSGGTRGGKGSIGFVRSDETYGGFATPFGEASDIATGSDGRLWVVDQLLRSPAYAMTTAGVFTATAFHVPNAYYPRIVAGPDGNLWITNNMTKTRGFFIVDTSGQRVTFLKKSAVSQPFLNAGKYLYARIIKPRNQQVAFIGKWNAGRQLVATYQVGGIGEQLTVDDSGALWFKVDDATLGRVSSKGVYCELAVPPSTQDYAPPSTGLIAAPDGYLYYTRGKTIGKIKIPK